MKTRIISGAALVIITASVIFTTLYFNLPIILTLFLIFLGAMSTYEMLFGTGIVKNNVLVAGAVIYAALAQLFYMYLPNYIGYIMAAYGIFSLIICFIEKTTYKRTVMAVLMPIILGYCFSCIGTLLSFGLMHLLLLLNFSCVCDCGAYFVGVTLGKHKLCPKISPKKTVEGAVGGIVLSMIVTAIVAKLFNIENTVLLVLITPLLCVAGIIGDLSASVIKRRVGIKDYGKIIPGHGGIMDRFDSILLIAPIYVVLYSLIG